MAELVFDPNEYLRNMSVAKTATSFQEGQKAAADIATAQDLQRRYQQELAQREQAFPLELEQAQLVNQARGLQNTVLQQSIAEANRKLAAQQEYISGMGSRLPTTAQTATGAGLLPTVEAPAAPTTGMTPGGLGAYTTVPTRPTDYTARMLQVEGGGRNPMSSAQGPGQFIDSTFVQTFRKTFPDASRPMSDAQILATRGTGVETAMLKKFTEDNQSYLSQRGIAPTNTNTYLAHFLGAGGATKVLSAAPNTPIEQVVDAAAIAANPSVFRQVRTAGDMQQWAALKMGESIFAPTPMGAPTGLTEPTTPTSVVAPIMSAKPGEAVPAPAPMTYLRNPPKITQDMQLLVAQDQELTRYQRYLAQSGDIAGAAETGLKRLQLRTTASNLQGLQAITNFDVGDNISLSDSLSKSIGRQVGLQPLSNGNFNILVDGRPVRSNVSRADVKDFAQYTLSETYRAQTMEMQKKQYDLQIELLKKRVDAGYKVEEKRVEKLYEGITKLQAERLKLSGFDVREGEDGKFFVYRKDGSYAAYIDPQGQITMPDGTVLANPSVTNIPLAIPMTR